MVAVAQVYTTVLEEVICLLTYTLVSNLDSKMTSNE